MTAKEMLAEVIRRAALNAQEKQDLIDLWDRIHRYNNVSDRQKAWIEKIYFGQKLDRDATTSIRRRVVIPTWQKDRKVRHVDTSVDASPMGTVASQPAVSPVQTSRMVAVKSTDILAKRGRSGTIRPKASRPSNKSGTFVAVTPQKAHRIGYINYDGAPRELLITNMLLLHEHCPRIRPGTVQYQKIEKFFRDGGQVLKIKPAEASQVA